MATGHKSKAVQHLRRAVLLQDGAGLTDGELLACFIEQRDDAAFAALVRRHGPMVWGLCRRLLSHHDAEDAFQAAFLVLCRKAASIRPRDMVANWLYGVARQAALQAGRTAARRRARERQVADVPEPAVAAEQNLWEELRPLLDQELSRLPANYRAVIVLCDLEGKTRKEAARQLDLPEGTVASRLARARAMLAKRLARRGLAVSGGVLAAVLSRDAASACVPASAVSATIESASVLAAGPAAARGIPAKVTALTEGVLKTMLLKRLKAAIAVSLVLVMAAFGGGLYMHRAGAQQGPADKQPPVGEKGKNTAPEPPRDDKEKLQGTWKLVETHKHGRKVDPKDVPIHPHELVIDGSKVATKLTPKGGGDRGEFELNAAATPKEITITWLIQWRGIYKLEKDRLTICFNPDNGIRPDEFRTAADSGRVLFVYERVTDLSNSQLP